MLGARPLSSSPLGAASRRSPGLHFVTAAQTADATTQVAIAGHTGVTAGQVALATVQTATLVVTPTGVTAAQTAAATTQVATAGVITGLSVLSAAMAVKNQIAYLDLAPAALNVMSEAFVSDTGQFTKYTESTAGTTSVSSGSMTVTHTAAALNDIVTRADIALSVPQFWAEAAFANSALGTNYDGGGVGIFKDANNFLIASFDKLNSFVRVQIKVAGVTTFLGSITNIWGSSFKIAMSLVGNSVCVYADTGSGWIYKLGVDVTSYYDLRTAGNLAGWKPGFTTANGGSTSVWAVSAFKAGSFGGVGMRDQSLVTTEEGNPYFSAVDKLLFTATALDPRGAGYCGSFELDLTARTIAQKSVIFVNRGGKSYNDLSAHVIRYPNGNRRMLIGTWANGFGGSIQTLHQLFTSGDVLTGVNLVAMAAITLPGQTGTLPGAYDAMMAWDAPNARWLVAYTLTNDTNFTGSPFYAAACYTTDWSTFTLIAKDSTNTGYEGTKLIMYEGVLYIAAGGPAGAGTTSRVFDKNMTYLGALKAVFQGGADTQPHPMVFTYGRKQFVLTFDNTKAASGANFTWGNPQVFEQYGYAAASQTAAATTQVATAASGATVGATAAQTALATTQVSTLALIGAVAAAQTALATAQTATAIAKASASAAQTAATTGQAAAAVALPLTGVAVAQTALATAQTATATAQAALTAAQTALVTNQVAAIAAIARAAAAQTAPATAQAATLLRVAAAVYELNERTFVVGGANRTFGVPATDRAFGIPAVSRSISIPGTSRTLEVEN